MKSLKLVGICISLFITLLQPLIAMPGGYAATVSVEKVLVQDIVESISVVGECESSKDSWVDFQLAGKVIKQNVIKGDWVKQGEVLAELDTETIKYNIQSAKAMLKQLQSEFRLASALIKKSRVLVKDGHLSKESLEKESTQLAILSAKLDHQKSILNLLEYQLKKHSLKAPYSGLVVEERVSEGEWAQPGAGAIKILNLNPMVAVFEFPEIRINQLDKTGELLLAFDSLPNKKIKAKLHSVLPSNKKGNRMVRLRYHFENDSKYLLPEMSVKASIQLKPMKNSILVPKDSIVMQGPMIFVYIVGKENKAKQVMVNLIQYFKGYAVVKGELKAGDQVVTRGNEFLQPDTPLKIVDPNKK
jgi:membrane fusion protein, multidrug efflux system